MKAVLWILPVLGLVSSFEVSDPALAEDAESLLTYHATVDDDHRVRRSPEPEPFRGSVGGGSGFKLPPGVTVFNPKPKLPDAYNRPRRSPQPETEEPGRPLLDHRVRRSPEPEPFRGSVGGGSGFKLPPGVTVFNPNPKLPDAYSRPRRSPQPGKGGPPPFRPPPNWRPPVRPFPVRDPGRPWLRFRRSPQSSSD